MGRPMYVVLTYNQASHCPELDYSDVHWGPGALDSARAERDDKAARTAEVGRGERHVIAEVTELEESP
jgi:hypothetical protein